MMELDIRVKKALIEIDFIKRYEALSNKFNNERTPTNKRLRYFDGELVMEIIEDLGYSIAFESKEKFFYTEKENIGKYEFSTYLDLDSGMVEFIWNLREEKKLLLGTPIGEFSRNIVSADYRIKKPIFGTYEDLDEIFAVGYQIYEDFKKAMAN